MAKASHKLSSDSVLPFKSSLIAFLLLSLLYGGYFLVARRAIYTMNITPLPQNSSLHTYSEGRVMNHIWHLAGEIGNRQEGSVGLIKAAEYLKAELEAFKKRSSSKLKVDIDVSFVSGSFSMNFLKHSITLAYRNHSNIGIRIAAVDADDNAATVLVNGHFDSALGSPGAGDCAACVASMLEAVRFVIDTDWVPPHPIIFLFNGAEEVFMLACHGFMTTHKWRSSVGALINIESSGSGGPDLVCQYGPGSWPVQMYAESAVHPRANSVAQVIFPHIPGDTDYRIFSEDYGDVPGLDIIQILGGYVYHTGYDTPEKIVQGSMQSRGENLISLLKSFTSSSKLLNAEERSEIKKHAVLVEERRPIFFDFLGLFTVYYSHKTAMALHLLPLAVLFLVPSLTSIEESGFQHVSDRVQSAAKGLVLHVFSLVLGIVAPVCIAMLRLLTSSTSMTWFAHPWLAFAMFFPSSLAGFLLPRIFYKEILLGRERKIGGQLEEIALDWGFHWGAVAFYAFLAAIDTYIGLGSGFLPFWWSFFMIFSFVGYSMCRGFYGQDSLLSFLSYILPLAAPALLSVSITSVLWQVVEEKLGMTCLLPQPFGFYSADVMMAAITGATVVISSGPVLPLAGKWLASKRIMQFLFCLSIGFSVISSQLFPYNADAPKRVLLQHTFHTAEGDRILHSNYDIAVIDSNPLSFVFKNVPLAAEMLGIDFTLKDSSITRSRNGNWLALYPIQYLFSESIMVAAESSQELKAEISLPHLFLIKKEEVEGRKRLYLQLAVGSLQQVWAAVLNITGPLVTWSFADQKLPVPETVNGGPESYICRLTGLSIGSKWDFWVEANNSKHVQIDLAIMDQHMDQKTQEFIDLFPPWVSIVAASSYLSSYLF